MTLSTTYSVRARYIFPVDRDPIPNGRLTISDGRIVEIGSGPIGNCIDLGDAVLLPGFINAHTHLEFSQLEKPLGRPGMIFPEWIREVIRHRRAEAGDQSAAAGRDESIPQGLVESLRGGTTFIGEIATMPWASYDKPWQVLPGVCFLELLGAALERHDELILAANDFIDAAGKNNSLLKPGLSPHAPYTVSRKLVEAVATLSAQRRTTVAMHLAESPEEVELLRNGTGHFRNLLEDLGAWYEDAFPLDSRPLDYLKLLASAHRSLIIHGNYLDHDELEFVGQCRDNMSVIYCPRTHAYFGHDQYPLQELLSCGANVALGTDSRASNPDLSMLNEFRFAAQQHQNVAPASILRLATINPARAFGIDDACGTLTPGKQADFIVIQVSPDESSKPYDLVLESRAEVQQVFRAGRPILPSTEQ